MGLDFLAHPFWDKYIEYEERVDAHDKIFHILDRIVRIPMHQYARYFERYRSMAANQPVNSLGPEDVVNSFRQDIEREGGVKPKQDADKERELRQRLDQFHLEIFHRTQTETTKRWTYEQEIKRPYFHVTELDEPQLLNWRKYLDFEEAEGDYRRAKFLYERCLVTAANYDEFWLRYARWMKAQDGKEEEVRNIYQRASCLFVPISRPIVRLRYAHFEESLGYVAVAKDVLEAILINIPSHLESIVALVNIHRRQQGVEAAIQVLKQYLERSETDVYTRGALAAEWARLVWEVKGQPNEARKIYKSQHHWYLDCKPFWTSWFLFELKQPTSGDLEAERHQRVKAVFVDIRQKSHLSSTIIEDMANYYMAYLEERGGPDAMKEFMELDKELLGPISVRSGTKAKLANDGKGATTQKSVVQDNGHPGVEVNENAIRQGGNPYSKYYAQQGEAPTNGHPAPMRYSG